MKNKTENAAGNRFLLRLWHFIRYGLPSPGRYKRYTLTILPILVVIWALVFAYLSVAPLNYKSSMTLILPGSGMGGSLNLESIGQASAQTSSAFAGTSLSPTENYKRLLSADSTLRRAAEILGEPGLLPAPTIKLVDQTNLILVSVSGPSPENARGRLNALRQAFLECLAVLRDDEQAKREAADREQLENLEAKARAAQLELLEFQGESGLATMDQFNSRIQIVDDLRAREREALVEIEYGAAATKRLAGVLKTSIENASLALVLKNDPVFQSLIGQYASVNTQWTEASATLGDRHMSVAELRAERGALRKSMLVRGRELTGLEEKILLRFVDISTSDGRERIFEQLIIADGDSAAAEARLGEIRRQIDEHNRNAHELVTQAAKLSDLLRARRVAEAVVSSALARLDTNKADPFASYPLVQTFEWPSLPTAPSSPSTMLAIAGGVAASFFVLVGFLMLWLRQPLLQLALPKS
ncbi:hypothetical protein [Salinisphaera sp.]|uniref:GumC family protein n=1 Tax=Salinisphaera sp. TaxID=1914330 RepID=UPI000C653E31|nr:hypothetical protein [Salinisphaera sp.]MBS64565.1 hypothetical protein [Salinisphaera sp.]